ncbi:MAG: cell division protein FtsZ [Gammaproteobacteria bacterium]|nr:cell division protein FtsZ [Gammaproteobacteria bacterium]MBU1441673.1 cell division protein FtsZ [Gammaproteobacteria bacterium]MBU2284988.1 cell division protein FtsZ [Gammaproteobacteria bacterium]
MSSLTVALAILGGLVLAAVIAYNAWMTRRSTPRQAQAGDGPVTVHGELPPHDPVEPSLHSASHSGFGHDRHEPLQDPDLPAPTPLPMPVAGRRGGLDPLIDVLAPVALEGIASGDAAIAAMPATRRAGSKPVAIECLNAQSGEWEPAVAGQRYRAFQVGVQLANRTGALNAIEYSEFVVKAQAFADAVNGTPEFPEMLDEVARARELDQFASEHDAQLSFVLRALHAAWSPGYVQQNAMRHGFVAGIIPGRMVLPAGEAGLPPILVLSFDTQAALADDPAQSAIRELTLSLDVPQVDRNERPFERMREIASALAREMDGVVTDSDVQPLRDETLDAIGADLEQLYDTLDARDLSAGSALARRLFS